MVVPGAFELPLAATALAKTRRFACIVALGCVIRGDTPHFDYVASEAASGLQLAALETGVPVSFGVLTLDRVEQAEPRIEQGRRGRSQRARDGRPLRPSPRRRLALTARPLRHATRASAADPWPQRDLLDLPAHVEDLRDAAGRSASRCRVEHHPEPLAWSATKRRFNPNLAATSA